MKKQPLLLLIVLWFLPLALLPAADLPPARPFPNDADGMGRFLCGQMDLTRPGLEQVRQSADAGNYAAALSAWRDWKVMELRRADLGPFGWHGDQLNGRRLAVADLLVARISRPEYEKINPPGDSFTDYFGLAGPVDQPLAGNWLAKDPAGKYPDIYMNFFFAVSFSGRYWQNGDPAYLKKWFQITADFACNQKRAVEALDRKTQRDIPCNWSIQAQAALSQGDRVFSIIRSLGVLCKSLPAEGKPTRWDAICKSVAAPLPNASRDLVPPVGLAQIALSLVQDHPGALLERYQKAGAVPNQRRNGLAAVLFIATVFPEFSASRDLLKKGGDGLDDYLVGAFHADGGMLEQSFNYNFGDANSLGEMADWLRPVLPELALKLEARQKAFYRLAAALASPLVRLPAMSSYAPANTPPIWKEAKTRAKWLADQAQAMPGANDPLVAGIAARLSGQAGQAGPAFASIAFPYSGYYVQRLNWGWDSPCLFLQGCRYGRGHRTLGHNAIQVFAYGRPLLVTAGVPVYGPQQLPAESRPDCQAINELLGEHTSLKVNTVLVDGKSQNKDVPVAQTSQAVPIAMRWHASPRFDFVEGLYEGGYPRPGVSHRRQVIFVRDPGFWIVTDIMGNADQREHQFTQVWNFPGYQEKSKTLAYGFKNEQVVLDAAGHNVHTADPDGPNLWLSHCGGGGLEYEKHFGEKNPYLGWFSPGFGNLIPAPQVLVKWKSPGSSVLITVLWPAPDHKPPGFKLSDKSPGADLAQAGFEMELPDGRSVKYQVAHDPRRFQAEGITMEAQALLSVKAADGTVRGLVLGRRDAAPEAFEFRRDGQALKEVLPIECPKGFSWRETAAGLQPDYAPRQ
jgi:hypothetical protein